MYGERVRLFCFAQQAQLVRFQKRPGRLAAPLGTWPVPKPMLPAIASVLSLVALRASTSPKPRFLGTANDPNDTCRLQSPVASIT